jgi:hypothetical protein
MPLALAMIGIVRSGRMGAETIEHLRTFAEKMLSAMRNKFGGHVEIYAVN